ncbi:MAG TPA: AraC family transcriptional regulator, partial [Ruminococcus flavefaciens]|nr:AraC family transcriptional regulator [Ruminococcus flavefaciens]
ETIPRYNELKAIRDAIYDEPMTHWSAEEISEDMGISRPYFHRLYLSAFGVTCRQDIIESRLIYASELLRTTDMSISAVAETCGYDSDAYFMRQFKQHKGCTPSEYRRRTVSNGDLAAE